MIYNATLFEILRTLRSTFYRIKLNPLHQKLAKIKGSQKKSFYELRGEVSSYYLQLKKYNIDKFTTPLWKTFNKKVEEALLPNPPFGFLNNPTVMFSMFATTGGKWMKSELAYLEKQVNKKQLKELLIEDYVGEPLLLNKKYLTSHTSIHHLYHFMKYLEITGSKLKDLKTIVEWGGGYGNMIKIIKRMKKSPTTYIMVDTPLFCCLQWLYLSTIFGKKTVHFILSPNDTIKKNKINILPICFIDNYKIQADLFVSTWALSESSKYSQDYVEKKKWFNTKHMLIAYQENPSGLYNPAKVGKLASSHGALIHDIEFLPGNHYAFK